MLRVWLQLIDGRHCLLGVKTHSARADLSVFSKTVVRCQLFLLMLRATIFLAICLVEHLLLK